MGWQSGVRVAGLIGGLGWLGGAVLDVAGAADSLVNAVYWGGAVLIAVALVGIGAGLVSAGALWLRIVVAVCLAALAAAVVAWLHGQFSDRWVDAALGLILAAYCAAGLWTTHRRVGATAGQ